MTSYSPYLIVSPIIKKFLDEHQGFLNDVLKEMAIDLLKSDFEDSDNDQPT